MCNKDDLSSEKMFRCCGCGNVFPEENITTWYEPRGEFWGQPVSEEMSGSPCCKDGFDEVFECFGCGEFFTKEEFAKHLTEQEEGER